VPKKTIDIYDKLERGSTNNLEIKGIWELTKADLAGDIPDQRVAWGEAKKLLETRVEKSSSGAGFNQELLLQ